MYITKEQTHNTRNGLVVTKQTTYIDDLDYNEKMKAIYGRARKIRREKIAKLTQEAKYILSVIQLKQLEALQAETDYEARVALEYIDMILKPELTRIKQDLIALNR